MPWPLTTMNSRNTALCSTKSKRATPTEESGRISRGNATFFTRFALSITALDPDSSDAENRFHASRPESRNTGKSGTRLPSTTATKEKTARNTIGFSTDQIAPRNEAVYLTFSSLRTRFARISR